MRKREVFKIPSVKKPHVYNQTSRLSPGLAAVMRIIGGIIMECVLCIPRCRRIESGVGAKEAVGKIRQEARKLISKLIGKHQDWRKTWQE